MFQVQLKEKLWETIVSYSVSWWHSFCCQFMWQTYLMRCYVQIFSKISRLLFLHCICTHIYIETSQIIFFLCVLFSSLKIILHHMETLISQYCCLKVLPSEETKRHPDRCLIWKRVSESIYWPITLLCLSYWVYHRHTMQS